MLMTFTKEKLIKWEKRFDWKGDWLEGQWQTVVFLGGKKSKCILYGNIEKLQIITKSPNSSNSYKIGVKPLIDLVRGN